MLVVEGDLAAPKPLQIALRSAQQRLGLLGDSGIGKTSLLRAIAGLSKPKHLAITLNGAPQHQLAPQQRRMSLVTQDAQLISHWHIAEHRRHLVRWQRQLDAQTLTDALGISPLLQQYPHQLSGGERQRVCLWLALLREPELILLDEPFTGMDPITRTEVQRVLQQSLEQLGSQMILVSHQQRDMMALCDELWCLESNESCAQLKGPFNLNAGLQHYLGINRAPCVIEVNPLTPERGLWPLQMGKQRLYCAPNPMFECTKASACFRVEIDANDVGLSPQALPNTSFVNQLHGRIVRCESFSEQVHLVCEVEQQRVAVNITQQSATQLALVPGAEIWLIFKAAAVSILSTERSTIKDEIYA